ncbi:MAG: peptidoglycan-binding domain-containing protein [bacterium]|nr:peptidoglycan-binding domain-containing protein [bacterium]
MKKPLTINNAVATLVAILFIAAPSAYAAPVLSQTSVTVGLGQTTTVTAQSSSYDGVYMSYNSNGTVVSVQTSGNQITVTGNQIGSANVSICYVGTANDCTNLNVTVNTSASSNGSVSLDNANPSVVVGQAVTINASGGSGYYVSANSNASVASYSISGSVITVSGLQSGSTTVTICSAADGCASANINVIASSQNSSLSFGTTNPTVGVGQTISVSLSGGEKYFIFANSNNNIIQAVIKDDSYVSIYGVNPGSASLKVCVQSQPDNCGTLQVTVTSAPVTAQPATTATVIQSSPVITPSITQNSSITPSITQNSSTGEILAAVQSMQNQLAQILQQIQSMTSSLNQITSKLLAGSQAQTTGTVAGSYFFTQFLSVGSENAEVTALQQKLTALGFYSGPVTGYFGPLTETAVSNYQSARDISPVGYIGPGTRAILNSE